MRVLLRKCTALFDRRLIGREFDGYILEELLGQGRFASCFRARGPMGTVVMKLVKPKSGRMDAQAIWTECKALQACHHPAIPQWLGIVNTDRSRNTLSSKSPRTRKPYFIVEQLMPGASLAFWLQKAGHVFETEEIVHIADRLCDVLLHLEQQGIVHGDLRPANVLYDGERISLIDFGLALEAQDPACHSIDRDGLASVVLFLLYSDGTRIIPNVDATWREELRLPPLLGQCLEDLFDEGFPWKGADQVRERLAEAFRKM